MEQAFHNCLPVTVSGMPAHFLGHEDIAEMLPSPYVPKVVGHSGRDIIRPLLSRKTAWGQF